MNAYQPIETAPKDGSRIMLFVPKQGWVFGRWQSDKYSPKPRPYWTNDNEYVWGIRETRNSQPTFWMPVPPDPGGEA